MRLRAAVLLLAVGALSGNAWYAFKRFFTRRLNA